MAVLGVVVVLSLMVRATPPDPGDLPVSLLSSGTPGHAESAAALKNGRLVADGAGHDIMPTRPELVIEEIRKQL